MAGAIDEALRDAQIRTLNAQREHAELAASEMAAGVEVGRTMTRTGEEDLALRRAQRDQLEARYADERAYVAHRDAWAFTIERNGDSGTPARLIEDQAWFRARLDEYPGGPDVDAAKTLLRSEFVPDDEARQGALAALEGKPIP